MENFIKKSLLTILGMFIQGKIPYAMDSQKTIVFQQNYYETYTLPLLRELCPNHTGYLSYDSFINDKRTCYNPNMNPEEYLETVWMSIPRYKKMIEELGIVLPKYELNTPAQHYYETYTLPLLRELCPGHTGYLSYDSFINDKRTCYNPNMNPEEYLETVWMSIPRYKKMIEELGIVLPKYEQNRLLSDLEQKLITLGHPNFFNLHFIMAQRFTDALGEPNFTELQLNYFDDVTKIDVLEGMVKNPGLYNRLDTLDKLITIFDSYNDILPASRDILLFASRVNSEHLFVDDLAKQIKQVNRTYTLMELNDNDNYDSAMGDRKEIYTYMLAHGYNTDVDIGDALFDFAINEIKTALRLEPADKMRLGDNISISGGINIIKFNEDIDDDWKTLKQKFDVKKGDLQLRLLFGGTALEVINHYVPLINNGWVNIVDYDGIADNQAFDTALNPLKNNGAYYIQYTDVDGINQIINFNQDTIDVQTEVDRIALTKATNPIRLNYKALTYQDYLGSSLQRDLSPVSALAFDNIKNEALGLVDNADFGNLHLAQTYRNEITLKFDRVIPDPLAPAAEDDWKEQIKGRINEIWTKVPEALIDVNIARPGAYAHNPVQWQTALRDSKKLVLQNIVGAIADCNTGVNQKIGLLEQGWRVILGEAAVPPHTDLIVPVAAIIKNLKMQRIEELGKNPGPKAIGGEDPTLADEENMTAPALITERLRIGWGLGGDFQEIVGPRHGYGTDARNFPTQITRNLFERGQPVRQYNIRTEKNPKYKNIAVDAPMTVKTLVDAVYDEFDKSISYADLKKMVNGDFDLRKDELNPAIDLIDGVFINSNGRRSAKNYFSRNMAFAMLEKLNYIEIAPAAKTALYSWTPGNPHDINDDGTPGTYQFGGHIRNLHEWIESDVF